MKKEDQSKSQSPVVRELLEGSGCNLSLREDGSVTALIRSRGVQPKTITAYPLQWRELFRAAPELAPLIEDVA